MKGLKNIQIDALTLSCGTSHAITLSYQTFGCPLGTAPIVLVNHALTGNSNVTGANGWWTKLIGKNQVIDTERYAVLCFNIPGNGYADDATSFAEDYKCVTAKDIAHLFLKALQVLEINTLFALIGGSVGGGVAWEMLAMQPNLTQHFIPIATDWKATDWIIANCHIQDAILNHSKEPLADARMHAMTLYRTPESLTSKFYRAPQNKSLYSVESWLNHHGEVLQNRFLVSSYKLMNQILRTIDITKNGRSFTEIVSQITGHIHLITIPSDLLFKSDENWETYIELKTVKDDVFIHEIKSIHGHDAFLIEYQQLNKILKPIFYTANHIDEKDKPHYIRNW